MTKGKDGKKDRNKNRHSPDVQSIGEFKTWIKPQGSNIFSFPPLAIENDRYGKILFQNMKVHAVNYTAVSYRSWTVE